jgi:multicomponent Na+:H+ antiporter subunit F
MSLHDVALWVAMPVLAFTLIPVFIRLVRGPSLPDRVIALDLIAMLVMGMITVYVVVTDKPVLLDLVTVLALLSFLGAVAFARYLEKRGRP